MPCVLLAAAFSPFALAAPCTADGLDPASRLIVEMQEAAQGKRDADVWRSRDRSYWFLPLAGGATAPPNAETCEHEGQVLRRVAAEGDAVSYAEESGVLTYIDRDNANFVLDLRRRNVAPGGPLLSSIGLNYQLNATRDNAGIHPSAQTELTGYHSGWYAATSLGFATGKTSRFETYALKEDVATAITLRLGDAVTGTTGLGESMRFGGISWGTDITLQPADFSPVLPDLRGGNVVPGPMELFINDTLQFQQSLKSGVYDLRNIPAQLGFNSYRVRTTDALGNVVTVVRDIYLPASLLPPDVSVWRVNAGWRRQNALSSNFDYGAPLVSGSYARGLNFKTTASGFALLSREASTVSLGVDRRITDLWTVHASMHAARTELPGGQSRQGQALRLRAEGGSRRWRFLAEETRSSGGIPGLSADTAPLLSQQLVRAQWSGWSGFAPGVTAIRSTRVGEAPQQVYTAYATVRPFNWEASLTASVSVVKNGFVDQKSALLVLLIPLAPRSPDWRDNLVATSNIADGAAVTRLQYNASAIDGSSSQWTAAVNHDSRGGPNSYDAGWSGRAGIFDVAASGRAISNEVQAQISARSGIVWTEGSTFFTRPLGGAFAIVSTGEPDVMIYHDNRPVSKTNDKGIALVAGLRPLDINNVSINPLDWPIEWSATETLQKVVAPRGGGVRVSFVISKDSWPEQSLVLVLDGAGAPFPPGTEAYARDGTRELTGVINNKGQLWLGDLLPAKRFVVRQGGTECEYEMPDLTAAASARALKPERCLPGPTIKA